MRRLLQSKKGEEDAEGTAEPLRKMLKMALLALFLGLMLYIIGKMILGARP